MSIKNNNTNNRKKYMGILATISIIAATAALLSPTAVTQEALAKPDPTGKASIIGLVSSENGEFTKSCKEDRTARDCAQNDNNGEFTSNAARNFHDRSDHNNVLDD
jgi:hypothetical protein